MNINGSETNKIIKVSRENNLCKIKQIIRTIQKLNLKLHDFKKKLNVYKINQ